MEKITTDEAAKMLEHLTGKRYVISASKKEPMRVEYPGALHEKSGAAENGESADRKRSPEPGDHVRTGGRSTES